MQRRELLRWLASAAAGGALGGCAGTESGSSAAGAASRAPFVAAPDGTRLFVKDWGAGRPVVFVHGWGLAADAWDYQMVDLAGQGLRCIAYDARGHGRSEDPGRGFDFDTMADDLAAVIERLDLRDVTLAGHSMGGATAVRYLSRHGARRAGRLVLLAPTTPFLLKTADNPNGVDARAFAALRRVLAQDRAKWLNDNARPFVVAETSQETIQWLIGLMLQSSLKAMLDLNRALTETDFRPELARIAVPTLIVQGDVDRSVPIELTGQPTATLIPGSRLVVYRGAPHGLFVTHIERLNADIRAFIPA